MLRNYNEHDYIARVSLICNALYLVITGGYLLTLDSIAYSAPTYDLMSGILSLGAFGVLFIVAGLLIGLAALQEGARRSWSLLIGGLLGALMLGLYTMASFEGSLNDMLPLRYAVVTGFNVIIAGVGGIGLWINKRRS